MVTVALDHAMNRRLQTESMAHYEMPRGGGGMSFGAAPMGATAPPASGGKKKKGRKKMLSERGSARNDTFSSHMYTMKSRSRKYKKKWKIALFVWFNMSIAVL